MIISELDPESGSCPGNQGAVCDLLNINRLLNNISDDMLNVISDDMINMHGLGFEYDIIGANYKY